MNPVLLGQRWSPDQTGKVEALMLTEPAAEQYSKPSPYAALQLCTYDPNNAADVDWRILVTGSAESAMMWAHSFLMKWGVEAGQTTDLGTLIAKRQADQVIIDQAIQALTHG